MRWAISCANPMDFSSWWKKTLLFASFVMLQSQPPSPSISQASCHFWPGKMLYYIPSTFQAHQNQVNTTFAFFSFWGYYEQTHFWRSTKNLWHFFAQQLWASLERTEDYSGTTAGKVCEKIMLLQSQKVIIMIMLLLLCALQNVSIHFLTSTQMGLPIITGLPFTMCVLYFSFICSWGSNWVWVFVRCWGNNKDPKFPISLQKELLKWADVSWFFRHLIKWFFMQNRQIDSQQT